MNTTETVANLDALPVQQAWLRRLAGALTRDAIAAEDLIQEKQGMGARGHVLSI